MFKKTHIYNFFFTIIVLCSLICRKDVDCSEYMDTAAQVSKGSFRASLYYVDLDHKPTITVYKGGSKIQIGNEIFDYISQTEASIECRAKSNQEAVKVVFNPFGGFIWWGKIGSCDFTFDLPSANSIDRFENISQGIVVGLGLRYQVFPETIVTPGILMDFGFTTSENNIQKFSVDGVFAGIVDSKLTTQETQAAFVLSKKIKNIEPFGGIKVRRDYLKFIDLSSLEYLDGYKDTVDVFLGLKIQIYHYESVMLEANFIGETSVALGLGIGF